MVATGLVLHQPALVGWGGAWVVGIAIARSLTEFSITRLRAAGLEMLWLSPQRVHRVPRGESFNLSAELRNRSTNPLFFTALRALASPELAVHLEPTAAVIPAQAGVQLSVHITPQRVGSQGVYALSLEVLSGNTLFEAPLTFANPLLLEVMPRPYAALSRSPRGGRSRRAQTPGEGEELRELREHYPGDSFRRIAWKATARRGLLLVREQEKDEHSISWLVLDASVELWAGVPGHAPLDLAIDHVASTALQLLRRGTSVGLIIVGGARTLARINPSHGANHAASLLAALAHSTGCFDTNRSGFDESDVALRILEHIQPFQPLNAKPLQIQNLDGLEVRARECLTQAPHPGWEVHAPTSRERLFRSYLTAFGIRIPARISGDRNDTDAQLAQVLTELAPTRSSTNNVVVWALPPDHTTRTELLRAILSFPNRKRHLTWVAIPTEAGLAATGSLPPVQDALRWRAQLQRRRGEQALRSLGVRVLQLKQGLKPTQT